MNLQKVRMGEINPSKFFTHFGFQADTVLTSNGCVECYTCISLFREIIYNKFHIKFQESHIKLSAIKLQLKGTMYCTCVR